MFLHVHSAVPEDASSDSSSDSWQWHHNHVLSATSSQHPAGPAWSCPMFTNNDEVKRTSVATDFCNMWPQVLPHVKLIPHNCRSDVNVDNKFWSFGGPWLSMALCWQSLLRRSGWVWDSRPNGLVSGEQVQRFSIPEAGLQSETQG